MDQFLFSVFKQFLFKEENEGTYLELFPHSV